MKELGTKAIGVDHQYGVRRRNADNLEQHPTHVRPDGEAPILAVEFDLKGNHGVSQGVENIRLRDTVSAGARCEVHRVNILMTLRPHVRDGKAGGIARCDRRVGEQRRSPAYALTHV